MTDVRSVPLVRVEEIVSEGVGYRPRFVDATMPNLRFGYCGTNFDDLGASYVAEDRRPAAERQLRQAYGWCAERFPLSVRRDSILRPAIDEIILAHSLHKDEVLSASSAQAPGVVFLAAEWPLKTPYRLGSLIAHEAVHQALFVREAEFTPVRRGSYGFSPWKRALRPGRMVWHAFWTFTCQLALLVESIIQDSALLERDRKLASFILETDARVSTCLYSLMLFEVVTDAEMNRCRRAAELLNGLFGEIDVIPDLKLLRQEAQDVSFKELKEWADDFVRSQTELSR